MNSSPNFVPERPVAHLSTVARLGLVLAASLVLAGCNDQSAAKLDVDPTGVYALVSVNGDKLPASVSHEGASLQVRAGGFTIQADGTCTCKTTFVPPSGTEVTRETTARYTREGARLTMSWKGAGTTVGTLEGNTFTMNNEGMLFAYRK
jgi:predicted small secreted protein